MFIPETIDRIFDKPGKSWIPEEKTQVKMWLLQPPQRLYLVSFTLLKLRQITFSTFEDAEDTLQEFFLKRLDAVIDNYAPSRNLRFWSYLLFCLGRFARGVAVAIVLRRRGIKVLPLEFEADDGEIFLLLDPEDTNLNPEEAYAHKERRAYLIKCASGLTGRRKEVFTDIILDGMSISHCAAQLGISIGAVKTALVYAYHDLKNCLNERGFSL